MYTYVVLSSSYVNQTPKMLLDYTRTVGTTTRSLYSRNMPTQTLCTFDNARSERSLVKRKAQVSNRTPRPNERQCKCLSGLLVFLAAKKTSPLSHWPLFAYAWRLVVIPSLLAAALLAPSDVTAGSTAAALAKHDQPCDNAGSSRNPHECEHLHSQICLNVKSVLARDYILHDDAKYGADDSSNSCAQSAEKDEKDDWCRTPASEDA